MPHVAARGRGRRTMNEINMVPFIDVMLVLLIIFMVCRRTRRCSSRTATRRRR
ncbi:MAG: biopolymer transport protein [Ramlibacter sp.]|nr:biopolymer transport protein [Ramlibacter sp.]